LGIYVGTFDDLYTDILFQAGIVSIKLSEPVQKRVLKSLVGDTSLYYYQKIRLKPGFIQKVTEVIQELKAGGISPEVFQSTINKMESGPRLMEIGEIYRDYERYLKKENLMDYLGAAWSALISMQEGTVIPDYWSPLIVDGFDDFTPVQIRILSQAAAQIPELTVTLTGEPDGHIRPMVHKRFLRTKKELKDAITFDEEIHLDPSPKGFLTPSIRELERELFEKDVRKKSGDDAISLVAAPNREAEVRNALRWLKKWIIRKNWEPYQTAVLFRDMEPYRSFLYQTAEEYGLPIYLEEGRPLIENPAVAALINVLQIAKPGDEYLAWREVIEAWRSPYFAWEEAFHSEDAKTPIGIEASDAETLNWIARWGNVIQGRDQWEEAFRILLSHEGEEENQGDLRTAFPGTTTSSKEIEAIWRKFRCFVQRLQPPEGNVSYRTWVAWVEGIIGNRNLEEGRKTDLNMVRRVTSGPEAFKERDLEALIKLKQVLRGFVWAERTVETSSVSYQSFIQELRQSIEEERYHPSQWKKEQGILAADVVAARGLHFKAVAVLGLGEGEFPSTVDEDAFIRDIERKKLQEEYDLPVPISTRSWEAEYFYETITRASHHLLFTRSRIADNGALWQPSPYWEEIRRHVDVEPEILSTQNRPHVRDSASWGEVSRTLASYPDAKDLWEEFKDRKPEIANSVQFTSDIFFQRYRTSQSGVGLFDGNLKSRSAEFSELFDCEYIWSASRLESYKKCPFLFYTHHVLLLEQRKPPQEGLDARQLGNIYHHIFERLYRSVGEDPALDQLLESMPRIADSVLDAAPQREGFRETGWWQQTRQEIKENVARSISILETMDPSFGFFRAEQTFGITGRKGPVLVVEGPGEDYFQLRGFIDRVDRNSKGKVRIIDYKTSAPYEFHNQALRKGQKLQLPLYALAAERALNVGPVKEGFYFHVRHAEASRLRLRNFQHQGKKGPREAMKVSVQEAWKAIYGARQGHFIPRVPDTNCPSYCPAAEYCWHYSPRHW